MRTKFSTKCAVFPDYVAKASHLFRRDRCGFSRVERKRTHTDVASGKHGSRRGRERQEVDLSANQPGRQRLSLRAALARRSKSERSNGHFKTAHWFEQVVGFTSSCFEPR